MISGKAIQVRLTPAPSAALASSVAPKITRLRKTIVGLFFVGLYSRAASAALFAMLILMAIYCSYWWYYGSQAAAWASLRGHSIIVTEHSRSRVIDLGGNEQFEVRMKVENLTNQAMPIIGVIVDCCKCISVADLPMLVPSRSQRLIRARVTPETGGAYRPYHRLILLTSAERATRIPFEIRFGPNSQSRE